MSRSSLTSVVDEKHRHAVAGLLVRPMETVRDDWFPDIETTHAFELTLIGVKNVGHA